LWCSISSIWITLAFSPFMKYVLTTAEPRTYKVHHSKGWPWFMVP
jgi:hypothetical protein